MGLDIFKSYATDDVAEVEGVEMPVGDAKLLIARLGNKKYARKLQALYARNRVLLERKGDAADALSDKIMIETLADTVLLGWSNVEFDGKAMPYSRDNALKALAMKDFRKLVMELAGSETEYKTVKDADEGND